MKELVMTFDRSAGGLLTVRLPHPQEKISEAFIRSWMSEVMTSKLFEQDTGNEPVKIHETYIAITERQEIPSAAG